MPFDLNFYGLRNDEEQIEVLPVRITVTIARQLGSGGSEIGEQIAHKLGIRCLDREIVSRTAQKCEISEKEVAQREERVDSFWTRILTGFAVTAPEAAYVGEPFQTISDRQIYEDETTVMKSIAAQEDCVIVGRGASYVLEPHPGMTNIFLHAPLDFRIPRVMQFYGARSEAQARSLIEESDASRKRFVTQITGKEWADARFYDLCLDSSSMSLPELSDFLVHFIQHRISQAQSPR